MSNLVDTFRALMRRSPALPAGVLHAAYEAARMPLPDTAVYAAGQCREELAGRADTPVDLLVTLSRDHRPATRAAALVNPRLPMPVARTAAKSETDPAVLRRLAYGCGDAEALRLLVRRRLPSASRARTLAALAENLALPSDVSATLLLRLDELLPTDTTVIDAGEGSPLHLVADAVDFLLRRDPLLGAQVADAVGSMRALESVAMHSTTLTTVQWDRLLAALIVEPLAEAGASDLPPAVGNRAARLVGTAAALPATCRQAIVTAVAARHWQASTSAGMLRRHLDTATVDPAEQAARNDALAAQVAAMTDPQQLTDISERRGLGKTVARALVANPHLPSRTAARVALDDLRHDDEYLATCRPGDTEFLLGVVKVRTEVLQYLPDPSPLLRQLLELPDSEFRYSSAEWARDNKTLPLLAADDRMLLRWSTARKLVGVDEGFDRWMLDLLTPLLERPGGPAFLARVDATFTGTVAGLVALLAGTLADPRRDAELHYLHAA